MKTIEFSTNWNKKLDCDCFTTIRIHNPDRYFEGAKFKVILNGRSKPNPVKVSLVRTLYLKDFTEGMCLIDTGYGLVQTKDIIKKMYSGKVQNLEQQLFDFVFLRYDRSETFTLQQNLFQQNQ